MIVNPKVNRILYGGDYNLQPGAEGYKHSANGLITFEPYLYRQIHLKQVHRFRCGGLRPPKREALIWL